MPVTAKLSKKFYERFGDELTNELVEWFNQVDTSYRAEFRELFEVHFARFDARLAQGLAELGAELRLEFRRELASVHTEMDGKVGSIRTEMHEGFATLRQALALQHSELLRGQAELKADLRTEIAASRAEALWDAGRRRRVAEAVARQLDLTIVCTWLHDPRASIGNIPRWRELCAVAWSGS